MASLSVLERLVSRSTRRKTGTRMGPVSPLHALHSVAAATLVASNAEPIFKVPFGAFFKYTRLRSAGIGGAVAGPLG